MTAVAADRPHAAPADRGRLPRRRSKARALLREAVAQRLPRRHRRGSDNGIRLLSRPASTAPRPRSRRAGLSRHPLVVVADQAVNSLTNVVVVLLVAAAVPLAQFGLFAAATVGVQVAQNVAGAGIGDRVLQAAAERRAARYVAGARLLDQVTLGGVAVAAVGVAAVGWSPWLVVLALAPAMMRVDLWRVRTVSRGRAGPALAVDLGQGVAQVVGVLVWWRLGTPGGTGGALAVWAVTVLAVVAGLTSVERRAARPGRATLREAVSLRYGVEMAAVNGSGQIAQLVVTAQLGLTFSGTLRAAQVPFGIVVVLVLAARAVLIPAMRDAPAAHARRLAFVAAGAAVAAAAVFTVVTLVATAVDPLRFLVGGVHLSTTFVLVLGCGYAAVAAGMVQTYFLRSQHRDREVSAGRLAMLVLLALGTLLAVITSSAWVFLAALAVAWAGASVVMAVVAPGSRPSR